MNIKSFLLALPLFSSAAFAQGFQTLINQDVEVGQDLIKVCDTAILKTKICQFDETIYTTKFVIPKEYAGGVDTKITVHKAFTNTESLISIEIAGVKHVLNTEATQSFPFPAGTVGEVEVKLVGTNPGRHTVMRPFKANLSKLVLTLDGLSYVNQLLGQINELSQIAQTAQDYYLLQKKANRWLLKPRPQIEELKEELTGRDAADLSYDCLMDGNKKPHPLDQDECRYLKVFNDYLSEKDTGISETAKISAFHTFAAAVTRFEKALNVLQSAQVSVDQRYLTALETALALVSADAATNPVPTPVAGN